MLFKCCKCGCIRDDLMYCRSYKAVCEDCADFYYTYYYPLVGFTEFLEKPYLTERGVKNGYEPEDSKTTRKKARLRFPAR